jgi:hypothetical protein
MRDPRRGHAPATGTWDPQVGDLVCDCFYRHLRIVWIDEENDEIELEDGSHHSLPFCCDPPDHDWAHPEPPALPKREYGSKHAAPDSSLGLASAPGDARCPS